MKKLWTIFMLPGFFLACNTPEMKEKPFTLQGEIDAEASGTVYLLKREKGQFVTLDSTMIEDGGFTFKGTIDYPRFTYLKFAERQDYITFFLEPGEIGIIINQHDMNKPLVKGSKSNDIFKTYQDDVDNFDNMLHSIYAEYKAADSVENNEEQIALLKRQFDSTDQIKSDYIIRYIFDNVNSSVSAFIAKRNLYLLSFDQLLELSARFDPAIKESPDVIELNERIEKLRKVQIGMKAPEFIMNDTTDNPLALSTLFGKYLLVDFWASWCGPCRRENPNVVAAFQEYHDKGFDILGVSLDREREKWIEAIHADGLTWHHVSDLAYWKNAAADLYAVNSIPSNILLDPAGMIIARNLTGEDLHKKLAEIFKSPSAVQ